MGLRNWKSSVQGWRCTGLERLGDRHGQTMQSLLGHNNLFLKGYLKPLISLKHVHNIIPYIFLKFILTPVWRVELGSGNSLPKCAWHISYKSPLIWKLVHSKGFPLLTALTQFVKSRFNFDLCLWGLSTKKDNQNRGKLQIPLPHSNRSANWQ